jgi:RNA polymerase primary sigma factor/RNA polymerase sigma factor
MLNTPRARRPGKDSGAPEVRYVFDPSFAEPNAERRYASPDPALEVAVPHLPDETTRELAKRMHYAAYRLERARGGAAAARWRQAYYDLRDRVVLGNRKLIYPAVRRWAALAHQAEDLIGECHIVLLQAVASYNPWLGIRFSTYAFTCLMRALSRLAQRGAADRLSQSLSLENLAEQAGEDDPAATASGASELNRLDEYLKEAHPLLSSREKVVLRRRFNLANEIETPTLEEIGHDLGISKERVRQVQATALGKLRRALLGEPSPS